MTADPADVAAVGRVRALTSDAGLVHAALLLAAARRKGVAKFGAEVATRLMADPQGVEMASSTLAAAHKALRFARASPGRVVVDLCAGIGGDAMGLAAAGLHALAVDIDPARAWMAGINAGCESRCTDALDSTLPPGPYHIDPARRTEDNAHRLFRLGDLQPGATALRILIARRGEHGGAVKLGPGVDFDELRSLGSGEVEIISEDGRLTQAVLWTGLLAGVLPRRATLLRDGKPAESIAGDPGAAPVPVADVARFVFEVDASVERAGLLGVLSDRTGLPMVHPRVGLFTSDRLVIDPFLTPFEVLLAEPWNEKRTRGWLSEHDGGIVEVKTRGKAVDPDALQARLRGTGSTLYAVFVVRVDRELRCFVTRRGAARATTLLL